MARLEDRFRLLSGGSRTALRRQQTLRAAIDWSYDLLAVPERALLRRLADFAGGWTLAAAEAVFAGADVGEGVEPADVLELLTGLVDKSLVDVVAAEPGVAPGEARYRLLETVRQYAEEKLVAAGEAAAARARHRDWYLAWAERAEPELVRCDQAAWFDRYAADHDNFRAALEWSRAAAAMGAGGGEGAASTVAWGAVWVLCCVQAGEVVVVQQGAAPRLSGLRRTEVDHLQRFSLALSERAADVPERAGHLKRMAHRSRSSTDAPAAPSRSPASGALYRRFGRDARALDRPAAGREHLSVGADEVGLERPGEAVARVVEAHRHADALLGQERAGAVEGEADERQPERAVLQRRPRAVGGADEHLVGAQRRRRGLPPGGGAQRHAVAAEAHQQPRWPWLSARRDGGDEPGADERRVVCGLGTAGAACSG